MSAVQGASQEALLNNSRDLVDGRRTPDAVD